MRDYRNKEEGNEPEGKVEERDLEGDIRKHRERRRLIDQSEDTIREK